MSDTVVFDGELSLEIPLDGECAAVYQVGESTEPVINPLTVSENGTYTAESGVDGYSPVTVSIPQEEPEIEALTATENGTYTASGDGYNPVTVNVPSPVDIVTVTEATDTCADGYDALQTAIGDSTIWVAVVVNKSIIGSGGTKVVAVVGTTRSASRTIFRNDSGYGYMRSFGYGTTGAKIAAGTQFYVYKFN